MSQNTQLKGKLPFGTARLSAAELSKPNQTPVQAGLLGRLSVNQKLMLAGLVLATPFAISTINTINRSYQSLQLTQHQLQGQEMLVPISALLQTVDSLRQASTKVGSASTTAALAEERKKIEPLLSSLLAQTKAAGFTELSSQVQATQLALDTLNWGVESGGLSAEDMRSAYSDLITSNILPLFAAVSHNSGLQLSDDGDLTATELVNLATRVLPENIPTATRLIPGIAPILTKLGPKGSVIDANSRAQGRAVWDTANAADQSLRQNLNVVLKSSPQASALLGEISDDLTKNSDSAFEFVQSGLLVPARTTISARELLAAAPAYTDSLYNSLTRVNQALKTVLEEKASQRQRSFVLNLLLLLSVSLLAATLLYLIARAIARPLQSLTEASQRLGHGDLNVTVPITTRDELGVLSQSFNDAAAQLRQNADRVEQDRIEGQRLQQNIGEFLDVTMDIADGDLTKRGKVSDDVLGNVVDSINLMTEELASTLRGVQNASDSVSSGSRAMLLTTAQIEQGSTTTTEQARLLTSQAEQVSQDIQAMARSAQTSAETARRALLAAQQGQEAVTSTLSGMQSIRESSQSVSERVRSLSQRSEQIQDIVDTITHLASQTNLLSLHASIEAAGAGEAGSRFAIVAEEIRGLADESTAATYRVAALIADTQKEIKEVTQRMQLSSQQVEQGYLVAGQAGERLLEIAALAQDSAQLADDISSATTQQVRSVMQMGQGVQEIAQIAEASQESVTQGRSAAEELQQLSLQLNTSLSRFRLPH